MAVTLESRDLAAGMMLVGADPDGTIHIPPEPLRGRITRLLAAITAIVERRAPLAPSEVQNQAVIQMAVYLFEQPTAARQSANANPFVNSGAAFLLSSWIVRRAAAADPLEAL